MFYQEKSEFIDALYYIYFSTYSNEVKKNLLEDIYLEYIHFKEYNKDFEEIYAELTTKNFSKAIDDNFIDTHNGKLLTIKYLNFKKIKIHNLLTKDYTKLILPFENNKCNICGNSKYVFKYKNSFSKEVTYCKKCLNFGISDNINYRIHLDKKTNVDYSKIYYPKVTLSDPQKEISEELFKSVANNENSLVWAVCGAGKTEIVYRTILENLKLEKRICLAIPRKDVVKELSQRLIKDFQIEINILHGDEKTITNSNLYIMTTHQLVHYFKFFDLIIVDEVDAFPYNGDEVLEYSVHNALKDNCPLVFLSATPSKKIKKFVDNIFKLPIRYHRNLLPLPKIVKYKYNIKKIAQQLDNFLKTVLSKKRRALVFVPTIELVDEVVATLKTKYPTVAGVSSKDKLRAEKIEKMHKWEIDILVTTTILERGVTFDYLDVYVVNADHNHFTKEALIQIAGRVGRKDYDPTGNIIFAAEQKTKAIREAIKEINTMNELAKYRKLVKKQ